MKTEILKALKEAEGYLSGQELCSRFGVSRTAVWKVIRQLKEEGFQIDAVQNRGYRLSDDGDVLTQAELESCLMGRGGIARVEYRQEVDSTNDLAKRLAEEGTPHKTLVAADFQTRGKGRRGKSWVSASGEGIWMSLVLKPDISPAAAPMLTLAAAMAVAAGIREETGADSLIKWPNDIVADGKKLCGILTEMSAELDAVHYAVVGIGINANMADFPEEISRTATSLYLQTGKKVRRSRVIAAVMKAFEEYYARFLQTGDLSLLAEEYNSRLANRNRQVKITGGREEYQGTALGVNSQGELLVRAEDGTVKTVRSGEVSVRGIYGYI